MIPAGQYEGEPIKGKFQLGETDTGTLQLGIDMQLYSGKESVGVMTTILYFTDKSAAFAYERLRALGWKGTGADDIDKFDDCVNRVPCTVKAPEQYKDSQGVIKMGNAKLEIDAGAGTFTISKPLTADTFKARLRALGGASGAAPGNSGGGTPPPF